MNKDNVSSEAAIAKSTPRRHQLEEPVAKIRTGNDSPFIN